VFPGDGTGVRDAGSADLRGPGDPEDPRSPFTPLWRDVRVSIYDVRGRRVRDLGLFRERETERFNLEWDGRGENDVMKRLKQLKASVWPSS